MQVLAWSITSFLPLCAFALRLAVSPLTEIRPNTRLLVQIISGPADPEFISLTLRDLDNGGSLLLINNVRPGPAILDVRLEVPRVPPQPNYVIDAIVPRSGQRVARSASFSILPAALTESLLLDLPPFTVPTPSSIRTPDSNLVPTTSLLETNSQVASTLIATPTTDPTPAGKTSPSAQIIGLISIVVILLGIFVAIWWYLQRKRNHKGARSKFDIEKPSSLSSSPLTPYTLRTSVAFTENVTMSEEVIGINDRSDPGRSGPDLANSNPTAALSIPASKSSHGKSGGRKAEDRNSIRSTTTAGTALTSATDTAILFIRGIEDQRRKLWLEHTQRQLEHGVSRVTNWRQRVAPATTQRPTDMSPGAISSSLSTGGLKHLEKAVFPEKSNKQPKKIKPIIGLPLTPRPSHQNFAIGSPSHTSQLNTRSNTRSETC